MWKFSKFRNKILKLNLINFVAFDMQTLGQKQLKKKKLEVAYSRIILDSNTRKKYLLL